MGAVEALAAKGVRTGDVGVRHLAGAGVFGCGEATRPGSASGGRLTCGTGSMSRSISPLVLWGSGRAGAGASGARPATAGPCSRTRHAPTRPLPLPPATESWPNRRVIGGYREDERVRGSLSRRRWPRGAPRMGRAASNLAADARPAASGLPEAQIPAESTVNLRAISRWAPARRLRERASPPCLIYRDECRAFGRYAPRDRARNAHITPPTAESRGIAGPHRGIGGRRATSTAESVGAGRPRTIP
jgi:hypothetical protein